MTDPIQASQCLNPRTKWARFQSGVRPVLGYCCIAYIGYGLSVATVSPEKFKAVCWLAAVLAIARGAEKGLDLWTARFSPTGQND